MDGKDYLILIGAPKCGTTSLANWLARLPDTALSRMKESMYFTDFRQRRWSGPGANHASKVPVDEASFRALFDHAPEAGLRIEASTDNMYCPVACERIAAFAQRDDVGSVNVVAVLRDPLERIVSEYEHTLKFGWQSGSLMASLKAEPARIEKGFHPLFHHIARSRYATQLAPYREAFGDALLILDYHRLGEAQTLVRLGAFAGRSVDDAAEDLPHANARHVLARPRAQTVLKNQVLRSLGRSAIPRSLRPRVRRMITGKPRERYNPNAEEERFVLDALAGEIAACRADPAIPTDNWTCLHSA